MRRNKLDELLETLEAVMSSLPRGPETSASIVSLPLHVFVDDSRAILIHENVLRDCSPGSSVEDLADGYVPSWRAIVDTRSLEVLTPSPKSTVSETAANHETTTAQLFGIVMDQRQDESREALLRRTFSLAESGQQAWFDLITTMAPQIAVSENSETVFQDVAMLLCSGPIAVSHPPSR